MQQFLLGKRIFPGKPAPEPKASSQGFQRSFLPARSTAKVRGHREHDRIRWIRLIRRASPSWREKAENVGRRREKEENDAQEAAERDERQQPSRKR